MAGFELASARGGGTSIWDALTSAGFKGENAMKDFRAKMSKLNIPNDLGQKNSKALQWLNKNSKVKYVPLSDELLNLEKEMGISKSTGQKFKLSQKLDDVQKWAHKTFGKKTTMPKLAGILNKLDDIPEIAKKGTKYLSKLGFRMIAPLTGIGYATDILNLTDVMGFKDKGIEPSAKVAPQTERFRGGGMADIYDMTRPLGYALGGPAGMTEPERKDVEYSRIMKEFEDSEGPGEPGIGYKLLQKITGDETIDPIWKAKQFIKEKILRRTPGDQGSASGMNPIVEFQEMYDQYILDGGDMSFKEFFDMIQIELDKMAGE